MADAQSHQKYYDYIIFFFLFYPLGKGVMRKVLYVPVLGTNLYSVSMATPTGMRVLFAGDRVYLLRDDTTLMVGKKAGSLYHLGKNQIDSLWYSKYNLLKAISHLDIQAEESPTYETETRAE